MNIKRCLEILELESVSSPGELKRAYRDLVQIWHPDRFHGNPRLEHNAGKKLKEITLAYKHLLVYFDPSQSKRLRTSSSNLHNNSSRLSPNGRAAIQSEDQAPNSSNRVDARRAAKTGQSPSLRVYPARRVSSARKLVTFGFLCLLLGVAGVIIYFLFDMDITSLKLKGPSPAVLEKIKIGEKKKEVIKNDEPAVQHITKNPGKIPKPPEADTLYEIYLDSGNTILTKSWWKEGDMIMYKKYGGSMGIEKSRVKKIVDR